MRLNLAVFVLAVRDRNLIRQSQRRSPSRSDNRLRLARGPRQPSDEHEKDEQNVWSKVLSKGINLFYDSIENRKECCRIRKIEPLKRAFKGLDVWICGLRKDQSVTRFFSNTVEWDEANGLVKINPLINWTEKMVWEYIHTHHIPYNELHDKGFPSIGCQPCTRAVTLGEDIRSGRWWWEAPEQKECGLHQK